MKTNKTMTQKTYMILVVDRKKAIMFTLYDGSIGNKLTYQGGDVPQKVKHGDDTWDAEDKIFRHIQDHLHRHLTTVAGLASAFAARRKIDAVIIGGHKPLFEDIERHLAYPLDKKIIGEFRTELKGPFNEVLHRALKTIDDINEQGNLSALQRRLHG